VDPVPLDLNKTVTPANETFDWINSDITPWNETESEYPPTDDEVARTIILDGVQLATGPSKLGWRWSVNDVVDRKDFYATPYLVGLYSKPENMRGYDYDAINANGGYDNITNSYVAQKGEVLDIVIQNRAGETTGVAEAHPWHSHGNKYWDMGQGRDEFEYDKIRAYREAAKGKPFLRDTSVAYPAPGASYLEDKLPIFDHAGWRLFRIRVENPGIWLIHCHILPHAVMVSAYLISSTPS
jgi:L-ascorbate oxidase